MDEKCFACFNVEEEVSYVPEGKFKTDEWNLILFLFLFFIWLSSCPSTILFLFFILIPVWLAYSVTLVSCV